MRSRRSRILLSLLVATLATALGGCAKGTAERAGADAAVPVDAGADAKDPDPPDGGAECGNGIVEASAETCDDGNDVTESCPYGQDSCTVCDATCHDAAGATSYCGDTTTDAAAGEACDDGNGVTEACDYGDDGCTVCDDTCREAAGATSYCGDARTDVGAGETCDDGNTVTEVCAYGMASCTVCSSTCQMVAGAVSQCGDGMKNPPAETCDDGNTTTEVCTYGAASCTVCNGACQSVAGETSRCGDTTLDAPYENCDDGNAVTETCAYGMTSCSVCDSTCHTGNGITHYCGDGTIDGAYGEECEDLDTTAGDGCTPACFSESFESEPNEDGAVSLGVDYPGINGNDFASASADGPFNVGAEDYHIVASLFPAGDEDVFAVTAGASSRTLVLETHGPDSYTECVTTDTVVTIRTAAGTYLAHDDDSGLNACSRLTYTIAANTTVYVHVTEWNDDKSLARYFLSLTPQ